ncbi:hypothetical protein OAG1_23850 [Agarivorans sp. OAG1]|uniref:hypothetical protein n=1 Tax=Agarivorans sp. OAG1 TaxID=3082387 RepID=UPI002B3086B4|nr:hypothetical protein OAG1_23850 [Agarivorans sp. OAG1]
MKNPTGTKKNHRGTFLMNGGLTHVRYDHKSRPSKIDIKCPNCSSLAIAKDEEVGDSLFVGDMSPSFKGSPFSITCTSCMYRKKRLAYEELTEPYFQFEGRGGILWAWNREHLDMIYKYLNGIPIKEHDYKFYHTYIHGDWKKYKTTYLKTISKGLSDT